MSIESETTKKISEEFKQDAIKLVTEQGYRISEAARNLDVNVSVLRRWVKGRETEKSGFPFNNQLTSEQEEIKRLREENQRLRMEREILKKAAAFFANESK
ncbi:MAG: transposase [Geobacteraceae bacterium]|nr:transposase [Geobacteraceae bacterium]